jgi:RNA polymerase sigma-70 factor (ECF subfamily)
VPGANRIEASQMDDNGRAFLEAALPHIDAVYRVARNTSGDHHRAEDLVQETYLRAFAAFASHRGPSTKAWLVTICLNLARSEGRRRARRVVEVSLPEPYEPEAPQVSVPEEALANIDRASVSRALARVPEEQRLAIVLMDLAGHSASEAAEILGCPRNTVLSRVFRGRQRLASLLVEEDINRDVS